MKVKLLKIKGKLRHYLILTMLYIQGICHPDTIIWDTVNVIYSYTDNCSATCQGIMTMFYIQGITAAAALYIYVEHND